MPKTKTRLSIFHKNTVVQRKYKTSSLFTEPLGEKHVSFHLTNFDDKHDYIILRT